MGDVSQTATRTHINGRRFLWGECSALFFLLLVFFAFLHRYQTFPDPDSFYHAKMGSLLAQGTAQHSFPWLPLTILRDQFVDHHFLYHLLLVPFIRVAEPLLGTTIATIIFAALTITIFHVLLRRLEVRFPFFFTFILTTSGTFLFRMNLAKASSLSVLFFLLLIVFLWERRSYLVFIISFLYVWLFNGWPIALFVALALLLGARVAAFLDRRMEWQRMIRPVLVMLLGLGAGVVINPYFPENFSFFWSHIVRIAFFRPFLLDTAFGNEWLATTPLMIVSMAPLVFFLGLLTIPLFLSRCTAPLKDASRLYRLLPLVYGSGALALLFFLATLVSRRHIEYFVPSAVLFFALFITSIMPPKHNSWRDALLDVLPKGRIWRAGVPIFFAFLFILFAARDLWTLHERFRYGSSWGRLRSVGEYLRENTREGDRIGNLEWSDFPALFYWNDHNQYIGGLDPAFLAFANDRAYTAWKNLVTMTGDPREDARVLGVSLFVVRAEKEKLKSFLTSHALAEVYHDREASVYAVDTQ